MYENFQITGIDISSYQNPVKFDVLLNHPGVNFIILRAGDGLGRGNPDVKYKEFTNAIKGRKPRGAYWFLRAYLDNPEEQAKQFLDIVRYDFPEMGLYADIENDPTGGNRKVTREKWTSFLSKFLQEVDRGIPASASLRFCGLYTSYGFWNEKIDHIKIPNLYDRIKWVAQWPTQKPFKAPYPLPNGWTKWDIWQFSVKAGEAWGKVGKGKEWGVNSYGLDTDAFNGDATDFQRIFRTTISVPPPPPPKETIGVKVDYLSYIRRGPSVGHTAVMGAQKGTILPVEGFKMGPDSTTWYRIAGGDGPYQMWISSTVVTPLSE